ncbi:LexA family protein [Streptomyces sp. NPDC059766]|uniref:LexA family protein n=1 Tax=Streptomyces sp. NPDC059766 TaxID=3346940 RepID=UPI003658710B
MRRRPEHLTEWEEEILGHIRRAIVDRGEALSVREPGAALGLSSTSTVVYHLQNLEQRGALPRDCPGWRTCRLTR